jgi:hypothetical protein
VKVCSRNTGKRKNTQVGSLAITLVESLTWIYPKYELDQLPKGPHVTKDEEVIVLELHSSNGMIYDNRWVKFMKMNGSIGWLPNQWIHKIT